MTDLLVLLGASLSTVAVMAWLNAKVTSSPALKLGTFLTIWCAGILAVIALVRIAAEALR